MKLTIHEVGTRSYGPEVMAVCDCGWESGRWMVDAPDSVRDWQETHLVEVGQPPTSTTRLYPITEKGMAALAWLNARNGVHDAALD